MKSFTLEGNIVLPTEGRVIRGRVTVSNGVIESVIETDTLSDLYIMPGLIDAHVHIESSMLVPSEFARAAVVHGTTATVSDPHEIANVLGTKGVEFMIENGAKTPFRFYFGAPSCVPATPLESSGAVIGSGDVLTLLQRPEIKYLAEMMNFPGVIHNDPDVMAKLEYARQMNKPVDGHAPGLTGEDLTKYFASGISTDHECFTLDEAREKARLGMKILIREGSAARNFDELLPLLDEFPDMVMLCSDDKHPDDLLNGHINKLIARGLAAGHSLIQLVRACTSNPASHYNLDCGLLRKGDPADITVIEDLETCSVACTYIGGIKVSDYGRTLIESVKVDTPNRFSATLPDPADIRVKATGKPVKVIGAIDGQLITQNLTRDLPEVDGFLDSDTQQDILKVVVLNRYVKAPPAVGFIHGFGLKTGALASTVAHDSHNIIATGVDDISILGAIEQIIENKGGLSAFSVKDKASLALPVAGIMAEENIQSVAKRYSELDSLAKYMGSTLSAPFMTLSFMALLVIPELKIGDKGLFDVNNFTFTSLFLK